MAVHRAPIPWPPCFLRPSYTEVPSNPFSRLIRYPSLQRWTRINPVMESGQLDSFDASSTHLVQFELMESCAEQLAHSVVLESFGLEPRRKLRLRDLELNLNKPNQASANP